MIIVVNEWVVIDVFWNGMKVCELGGYLCVIDDNVVIGVCINDCIWFGDCYGVNLSVWV